MVFLYCEVFVDWSNFRKKAFHKNLGAFLVKVGNITFLNDFGLFEFLTL